MATWEDLLREQQEMLGGGTFPSSMPPPPMPTETAGQSIFQSPGAQKLRGLDQIVRDWMMENIWPKIELRRRQPGQDVLTFGWGDKPGPGGGTITGAPPAVGPVTSEVGSEMLPSPTPTTAPVPKPAPKPGERPIYAAPSQADQLSEEAKLVREPKEGEDQFATTFTQPGAAKPGITGMPTLPAPPQMVDYEGEIRKIGGMVPTTAEQMIGPRPDVYKQEHPITEALNQFTYGMLYGGAQGARQHREFLQKKLDQRYDQDLDFAVKGLDQKRQTEYAILKNKMDMRNQQEEGYVKFLEKAIEDNPDSWVTNPEVRRRMMQALHMDEQAIEQYMASAKQADGTYNFGMTQSDKKLYQWKTQARALQIMFPEFDKNDIAEMAVTGQYPDKSKAFENKLQKEMADAVRAKDNNRLQVLMAQWKAYKNTTAKSNLDDYYDQMGTLRTMKDAVVKKYGPEYYNQLESRTIQHYFGGVPKAEGGAAADTPLNRQREYDLRIRTTGLGGIAAVMYPEEATKEGGILFRQQSMRKAVDNYRSVRTQAQAMLSEGKKDKQVQKFVSSNVPKEDIAMLGEMTIGAQKYILGLDPLTGKTRVDPYGRPRSEVLTKIPLTVDNFMDIIEFIDMGASNAQIINAFSTKTPAKK